MPLIKQDFKLALCGEGTEQINQNLCFEALGFKSPAPPAGGDTLPPELSGNGTASERVSVHKIASKIRVWGCAPVVPVTGSTAAPHLG